MDASAPSYTESVPLIDFSFLLRVLRRRLRLIALVTAACAVLAVFSAQTTPDTYTATASIILDPSPVSPLGEQSIFTEQSQSNPVVESQSQLLRAPYLLSKVVAELGLDKRPEFMGAAEPGITDQLNQWIADRAAEFGVGDVLPAGAVDDTSEAELFEKAVRTLRQNLSVSRNGLTLVLTVRYTSGSAAMSAEIVNAVADAYINDQRTARQTSAAEAADWLTERIADLNERAVQAENDVAVFRQQNQIVNGGREGLVSEQQMARLTDELSAATSRTLDAKEDLDRLAELAQQEQMPIRLPNELVGSPLRDLNDQYSELETLRAQFAAEYGAEHAATVKLDQQLATLGERMRAEIEQEHLAAAVEYQVAADREAEVRESFNVALTASQDVEEALVKQRALESEAQVYRELHDTYLQNLLQTVQQESYPTASARVIGAATPPQFSDGPSTRWALIVASAVGLALGTGIAFSLEFLDGSIRTRSRLAEAIGAPVLGILPLGTQDDAQQHTGQLKITTPHRLPAPPSGGRINLPQTSRPLLKTEREMTATIERPLSVYSETVRRIKSAANELSGSAGGIVGFVSDDPSVRRSVVAINYAEMLALGGARTLLIDANWRDMYLTHAITPAATFGLADMLIPETSTPPESILWYDERTALQFLPNRKAGGSVSLDPAVFDVDRLRALLKQLLSRFDHIVIDFSDLSNSSTAAALSDVMTGFVVVAHWGETSAAKLKAELERSGIQRDKIIGGVLDGTTFDQLGAYESVD